MAEPVTKIEEAKKEQLSPLERAKGKEIIQDGQPIITWGSLKDLPTLDEVFPVADKPLQVVGQPKPVEQIQLPETEERKKLRKNIKDEFYDKLYAIKSPNGKCIIEFYGGTLPNGEREEWLRSIDPETKEVLWKYDEPGLSGLDASIDFPQESDYFIMTNLSYPKGGYGVKLFSCQKGYVKDIYFSPEKEPPSSMGRITPDGKNILISTSNGKVIDFDINGKILWEKQISPFLGPLHPIYISQDSLYFVTFYGSPEIWGLKELRRAGIPEELRLVEIRTGNTEFKKRFHGNLGDMSMVTNTMEIMGITTDRIVGLWIMDGIGFALDKTNPYGNTMLLFTKKDVFAFRIQTLGFAFSKDGKYLSANDKYYDLQSILSKAMENILVPGNGN